MQNNATSEEPKERFVIENEDGANWLLRKLATLQTERERVKAQADKMIQELKTEEQSLLHLYESELAQFAKNELEARGGRRKSLTLFQGTLAFRTVPAGLKLTDEKAALDFAVEAKFIGIKPSLDTTAYREWAEEHRGMTGNLLPGIESVPERESFSIKFGKPEKE